MQTDLAENRYMTCTILLKCLCLGRISEPLDIRSPYLFRVLPEIRFRLYPAEIGSYLKTQKIFSSLFITLFGRMLLVEKPDFRYSDFGKAFDTQRLSYCIMH